MSYFLIAVSNRENLDLCLRYALAGFPSSRSGLWAYFDIREGDFVSFLYGARAFNLYQVGEKRAYADAESLPPWPPVRFRPSGLSYYFPFRLRLEPVRTFNEPVVRAEFAYVAENLLLRGGYRKTHFQADQTTLQSVSEMGQPYTGSAERLNLGQAATFDPQLSAANSQLPFVFVFRELFLQALVRRHLSDERNLAGLLSSVASTAALEPAALEVLGEKAFPEGHVDLLTKEATPRGLSRKVIVEVKTGTALRADVAQLNRYKKVVGQECAGAVLIVGSSSARLREAARELGIRVFHYSLPFPTDPAPFGGLLSALRLEPAD